MDFNQLPQSKKEHFAKLVASMSNTLFGFLFFLVLAWAVWTTASFAPAELEVVPRAAASAAPPAPKALAWDAAFESVDYLATPPTEQIAMGRKLVDETAEMIGPKTATPYAGNNLNCTSCHLNGGSKPFAAPFVSVPSQFPQFRGRENKEGTLEERINGCMQRSMNGKPLPVDSEQMQAMVAYMEWLSANAPKEKIKGNKFLAINYPDRKVDLDHGKAVYAQHCTVCHMDDGQGMADPTGNGYLYPPLWGPDSYNHGAGMHRVLTAAQFIKGNMPLGTTADSPVLTDDEAFDVAGYINSFDRPLKANTDADFPDRTRKPMSTPYGPWADSFPAEQHKYGPFGEIAAYYLQEYGMTKTK